MEQRSNEWFEVRKHRITGSSVGAILGLNPWMSRDDVMRRMVREYWGAEPEFTGNAATQWGTAMEEHAIADFELETGLTVEPAGFVAWSQADWLGASPDGYVGDDALIEVKCPYGLRNQSPVMFKSISDQPSYYAQMQIQMLVTGRSKCYLWQWSQHGHRLEVVNADPVWIEENLPELELFYQLYLVARLAENAWQYLDGGELVKNYKEAKQALDDAKQALENARDALIDHAGPEGGQIGDIKVSRVTKKGAISYQKAIAELLPDADLEPYRGKDSEYWRIG